MEGSIATRLYMHVALYVPIFWALPFLYRFLCLPIERHNALERGHECEDESDDESDSEDESEETIVRNDSPALLETEQQWARYRADPTLLRISTACRADTKQ